MWGLTTFLRRAGGAFSVTPLMLGACGVLYLLSLALDPSAIGGRGGFLRLLSPSTESLLQLGASGPIPVFRLGRWWTLLSAGWLHGGILHIALNVMALRQLLPALEQFYGAGRATILYVLSGVAGFALSTASVFMPSIFRWALGGGGMTVGSSAALCGLMGALVHYSRKSGSRMMGQQVWGWALTMFAFGLLFRGMVDNWAHIGGFAGGWLLSMVLAPLREERVEHLIGGVVCLVATAAAIVWSLLTPLPL